MKSNHWYGQLLTHLLQDAAEVPQSSRTAAVRKSWASELMLVGSHSILLLGGLCLQFMATGTGQPDV